MEGLGVGGVGGAVQFIDWLFLFFLQLFTSYLLFNYEFGTLSLGESSCQKSSLGRVLANGESGERRRDVFPSFPKSVDH